MKGLVYVVSLFFVVAFFCPLWVSCYKTCHSTREILIVVSTAYDVRGFECDRLHSGNVYECSSLQEAFTLLSSAQEACNHFTLQLEPIVYYITRPIILSSSLSIQGSLSKNKKEPETVIYCTFDAETLTVPKDEETRGLHTLYFNQSDSVEFSNLVFGNCPLPIRIDQTHSVNIHHSSFRRFSEAVLDIHNCINVSVHNCSFVENIGNGIINDSYHGNSGGLSITYRHIQVNGSAANPIVTVSETRFLQNSAFPTKNVLTVSQAFSSGLFTGRGGGLALFITEDNFTITVRVSGCYFSHNFAQNFGGGMYILFSGRGTHTAYIEDNFYEENTAMVGGGGMVLWGTKSDINQPHSFLIKNCTFFRNFANVGGGMYYSNFGGITDFIRIENSSFLKNTLLYNSIVNFGAALAIDSSEDFQVEELVRMNTLKNCLFRGNIGRNSIISVGITPIAMSGYNIFSNNIGSVLRTIGARTFLSGKIEFTNNTSIDGAAIVLLSLSQVILEDNVQLLFDSNKGEFGASVLVSAASSLSTYNTILYNPLCFFALKSNPLLPPSQWKNFGINITFTKNEAYFGSAVFATSILSCSWSGLSIEESILFPKWPIFFISEDNYNRAFSDPLAITHSVVTDPVDIVNLNLLNAKSVWPGKNFTLSLQTIDELGNPTGSTVRLSSRFSSDDSEVFDLDPNVLVILSENFTQTIKFGINGGNENITGNFVSEIEIKSYGVFNSRKPKAKSVSFTGTNCIGGYTLLAYEDNNNKSYCHCDLLNTNVLFCEENQDSVIIKNGHWAMETNGSMFFHVCPPGYCRCFLNTSYGIKSCLNMFTNSDPDRQCVCGRKGILCGECVPGTGVSTIFNVCWLCETKNIAIIAISIPVIIVIMIIIVMVDKPLPQWSYPVLFYIHSVTLSSLNFPTSFLFYGRYLFYIASVLSFYFPVDFCLYPGMTSIDVYGLKFTPVISTSVAIPVAILIRYILSKCISSLSLQSFHGHGIWTILLLMYPYTLYSSINILNCPMLPDNSGKYAPRWFVNGSVECFTGKHLPLALFAILWIIVLIILIPVTVSLTTLTIKKPMILKKLSKSLKEPFLESFSVWSGVELSRRLFMVLFVIALPDKPVYNLMLITVIIFTYGYCNPYKSRVPNILEIILLFIMLVLLKIRANPFFEEFMEMISQDSIPNTSPCHSEKAAPTALSSIMLTLYYFPILLGLITLFVWIIKTLKKKGEFECSNSLKKIRLSKSNANLKRLSRDENKQFEFADRIIHPKHYDERHR